jgi:ribosomal protein L37AE/L43A
MKKELKKSHVKDLKEFRKDVADVIEKAENILGTPNPRRACPECGSHRVRPAGSCWVCPICGSTDGGC